MMIDNVSKSGSTEMAKVLAQLNQAGGFPIAVLVDRDGFPLASAAAPGQNPEMQSAVVAQVQKTVNQVSDRLGMAQTDEVSVYDTEGRRLVCRPFSANAQRSTVLFPRRYSGPDRSKCK